MAADPHREEQLAGQVLVTPAERFRGADYVQGTVVSGGVSGVVASLNLRQVSSQVRLRLLSIEAFNLESTGWMLFEVRDGNIASAPPIAGPYLIGPQAERRVQGDELIGRYATSAIAVHVMSGGAASPLSTGLRVKVSYFPEPTDLPGERIPLTSGA